MHYKNHRNKKLLKQTLYDHTTINQNELNSQKIIIKETLEIIEKKPSLNIQEDNFCSILKLYNISYNNITQTC